MKNLCLRLLLLLSVASLFSQALIKEAHAQQQNQDSSQQEQQEQPDDIVRITTELVQTDVSVFDKQGRFVDGLKREDFELRVGGKPQPVSFFDRIRTGSVNEETQLAAARGVAQSAGVSNRTNAPSARPLDRGRTVVFFVDDIHLAFDSLKRTRELILKFVNNEMGQNDMVLIASSSGQIGFLQQFTDNKLVLREAVSRLQFKERKVRDMLRPPMSEYQALLIDRFDPQVTDYFVEQHIRDNPGTDRESAIQAVRGRARVLLEQAASVTKVTLSTLDSISRSSARLAGRKLVFFISDGFFIDPQRGDSINALRRITDAAARSGVVIYTMEARGLVTGLPGAADDVPFDPTGRLMRAGMGELSASQDAMNALAVDTGGRAIRNTNALDPGVRRAIEETSVYYVLAWRPDAESQRGGKFNRIEVSVRNRPELSVRVQRGFFTEDTSKQKKQVASAPVTKKSTDDLLRSAIIAPIPRNELPTELALHYIDVPNNGLMLMASIKVEGDQITFKPIGDKQAAVIDVAGAIFNAQGKQVEGFRERLTVTPNSKAQTPVKFPPLTYNYRAVLKPGLYQVRVAARDDATGLVGSSAQWIEVPDLSARKLSLSSLLVGERAPAEAAEKKEAKDILDVPISVDRRFERTSHLRFLVYVYNAARGAGGGTEPDVALQVQVFRDDQPVITTPLRKLSTESQDLARIAYAAEIPLQAMTTGRYVLQVTAIDRIAKTSASQRVKFEIE